MADPIIQVENLDVIYNLGKSNEVRSLEGVSAKIFPHEYVIMHGPSGCGKSTLLYSIAGLQAPTNGEVTIQGKSISRMNKQEKLWLHRFGTGMIFQAFYLIPSLSIIDNVCLPMVLLGESSEARREKGMKLLRRFGIAEQARKFPSQLSGGQKQRVAIARALINDPQIILADEPVGNLDSESAENVLKILKELNEIDKKTVILVTHNNEHLHYANRILYLKDGRIVSEEVNLDKRPKEAIEEAIIKMPKEISNEMSILLRTFRNFSPQQMGALLVPYKAKQVLTHILAELTEEQLNAAENFLKDLLFNEIDKPAFEKNLDTDINDGGAGWNKQRVRSFSDRVNKLLEGAAEIQKDPYNAAVPVSEYLLNLFNLTMDEETKGRFQTFLRMRMESKIDGFQLRERLDASRSVGGAGLYKVTAEKMVKEMEILMLLKFSA